MKSGSSLSIGPIVTPAPARQRERSKHGRRCCRRRAPPKCRISTKETFSTRRAQSAARFTKVVCVGVTLAGAERACAGWLGGRLALGRLCRLFGCAAAAALRELEAGGVPAGVEVGGDFGPLALHRVVGRRLAAPDALEFVVQLAPAGG